MSNNVRVEIAKKLVNRLANEGFSTEDLVKIQFVLLEVLWEVIPDKDSKKLN